MLAFYSNVSSYRGKSRHRLRILPSASGAGDSAIAVCRDISFKLKTLKIRRKAGIYTAAAIDLQERLRATPVIETLTIM